MKYSLFFLLLFITGCKTFSFTPYDYKKNKSAQIDIHGMKDCSVKVTPKGIGLLRFKRKFRSPKQIEEKQIESEEPCKDLPKEKQDGD